MPGLDELPHPNGQRIAMTVSRDALRQIRGGHPWVYDSSVRTESRQGEAGDLAVIFGDRRQFAAIGLYDPNSPIRVKILHVGSARTIGDDFWRDRVEAAFARREPLWEVEDTTGFRCVHGENDALPGLVMDRYDTTLVVKVYSAAWWAHLRPVVLAAVDRCAARGVAVERVVLRQSRLVRGSAPVGMDDGTALLGDVPTEPVRFLENGLEFEADVVGGQKTGHFLDQRDNRALVGGLASGATVIDLFACTGGFSLYAAAGGATDVLSVDMSERSLSTARRNFDHNRGRAEVSVCRHRVEVGDVFDVGTRLADRGRRFDVVVVDPPSFASKQQDRSGALHAYGRLADLAMRLTAPGGLYVQSSCSSRITVDEVREAVVASGEASGRSLSIINETGHAIDHPIGFAQGAYLKTLFARVGR